MSEERIEKLPQWAQQYIRDLRWQREEAIKRLREFTDSQTEQHFFTDVHACIQQGAPVAMRRYIDTHWLRYNHRGLDFSIIEYEREGYVSFQYGQERGLKDILFQPASFQQFRIYYPEK